MSVFVLGTETQGEIIHVRIYMYMYIYIHTYTHTYTHAHTHTHTHAPTLMATASCVSTFTAYLTFPNVPVVVAGAAIAFKGRD